MEYYAYYEYLPFDGERFFTIVLQPCKEGKFPIVLCRSPYVADTVDKSETELVERYLASYEKWLARGYAVVFQHCKGHGKSTGAFVPYLHEREDGLFFQSWVRTLPIYNGELFLLGGSYTASLHYATAPFAPDIKGAIFEVQDPERYRLWYRNGQMRKGHANWHFNLYKSKNKLEKRYTIQSFSQLPLQGLSIRALGEEALDFEKMLLAPAPDDEFWNTRLGGCDTRNALRSANIPILLTTGYNDFYVGGVFTTWKEMDEQTREQSALLVSPYNHGDGRDDIAFPNGKRVEAFGEHYQIDWFDHVRFHTPLPFPKGKISYYRAFEKGWAHDFYATKTEDVSLPLGEGNKSFHYRPATPPAFPAEGTFRQTPERDDILKILLPPFERDIFIKGNMRAELSVQSTCEDTSFYVRISVQTPDYTYALRHDITSLGYQLTRYEKNAVASLSFRFDEYAFLLKRGDRLLIEIASTDDNVYVAHTNQKGAYHLQPSATDAVNTVHLDRSRLILPIETE